MSPRRGARSVSGSASVEDYAKNIYTAAEWDGSDVTASVLASRLGVANASVTGMVRKMASLGLVEHEPYGSIRLTAEGRKLALAMVRRHRLIETFLVEDLGYSWDEVHEEAEHLEHAVSDFFVERLAARLGDPGHDPHGDPIPTRRGDVDLPEAAVLSRLDAGHEGTVARVSDADPDVLRQCGAAGIVPGSRLAVRADQGPDGTVHISLDGHDAALPRRIADAVWIGTDRPHAGCRLHG